MNRHPQQEPSEFINDSEEQDRQLRSSSLSSFEQDDHAPSPFPSRTVGILAFANAMAIAAFNVIYPFVNQMIVELGIAKSADSAGYYSGLLQSGIALSGFLTTIPCSYASDIFGRKPVLIVSMVGLITSMCFFGTGRTFSALFICRCLGGGFGPNLTWMVSYTILGEITDPANAAPAYSAVRMGYAIGNMISPSIGGFLAHPGNHFGLFKSELWIKNPYALPCFTSVLLGTISLVVIHIGLAETLPSKRNWLSRTHRTRLSSYSNPRASISEFENLRSGSTVGFRRPVSSSSGGNIHHARETSASLLLGSNSVTVWTVLTPQTIPVMVTSFALSFISAALAVIYPLWAFMSINKGGLGAPETSIGLQLSLGGLMDIFVTSFYGYLEKRLGLYKLYSWTMAIWIPTALGYPLLSSWAQFKGSSDGFLFQVAFVAWFAIWSLSGLAWSANSQMVNQVAPSEEALARTIGVSTIFTLLGGILGPIVATSLYQWSASIDFANGNLIWIALFIFSTIAALHAWTLREPKTWLPDEVDLFSPDHWQS